MNGATPALVVALDGLRCRWLRWFSRTPGFAFWFPDARRRLALAGAVTFVWATMVSVVAPVSFLVTSTLILGPLHILSHLRFLPAFGWGGGTRIYGGAFVACSLLSCVVLTFNPGASFLGVTWPVLAFRAAALILAGVTIFRWWRVREEREVLGGLGVALAAWVCAGSFAGLFALTFLHNLLAFVHWIAASREKGMYRFARLATCVSFLACVALGAVPWERFPAYGMVDMLLWSQGPWNEAFFRQTSNVPESLVAWAPRLFTVFVVSQSLHYFVWLRAIPDAQAARGVPRPFRATWRELRGRVGTVVLSGWAMASVVVVAWALRDPQQAKEIYLAFALMHALVEIASVRVPNAAAAERM